MFNIKKRSIYNISLFDELHFCIKFYAGKYISFTVVAWSKILIKISISNFMNTTIYQKTIYTFDGSVVPRLIVLRVTLWFNTVFHVL